MSLIDKLLSTTIRISEFEPFSCHAVWPKGIEVCITRVPIRRRDGFTPEKIDKLAEKLKSNMVTNGIVFLICYSPTECKSRPFQIAASMERAGFTHIDNIVIKKSWYPGKRSETNLVNSHEYVLYFCNGKVWKLDRLPIREYMKTPDPVSCPGNTWSINTGSLDESYPLDLAELLIRMTDILPGSILFDPFCGTTSSLQAALRLGHSFYAFETDNKKIQQMKKIIEQFKNGRLQ